MKKISTLTITALSFWVFGLAPKTSVIYVAEPFEIQESLKVEAFIVLTEKCNNCHATKKRTDIFTLENMDSLAGDIHKQVFIKKKMPKGKKVQLTLQEKETLKRWLDVTLRQ